MMFSTTAGILSLACLLCLIQPGHNWGANYDQARQYESSRLIDPKLSSKLRQPVGGYENAYGRPGGNSYDTPGRNDYGYEVPYQPPQLPARENGYGNNAGYGNNYAAGGGFNDEAREIVINDFGRPSIDDNEVEEIETKPSAKCRPFYSLNCERFCPAGNSLAPNGCRTCVCCPVLKCKGDCSHGVVTHGGCATCNCKTPPSHVLSSCPRKWCTKECKLGFVKDSKGCPLCKCKRRQYKTKWHSKFQ